MSPAHEHRPEHANRSRFSSLDRADAEINLFGQCLVGHVPATRSRRAFAPTAPSATTRSPRQKASSPPLPAPHLDLDTKATSYAELARRFIGGGSVTGKGEIVTAEHPFAEMVQHGAAKSAGVDGVAAFIEVQVLSLRGVQIQRPVSSAALAQARAPPSRPPACRTWCRSGAPERPLPFGFRSQNSAQKGLAAFQ